MGRIGEIVNIGILALNLPIFLLAPAYGLGNEAETGTYANRWRFAWSEGAVQVEYSPGFQTFVYTSAYREATDPFDSSTLYVYYEEGLNYRGADIVILDPDPPGGEDNTFLDLFFNESLGMELENYLCGVVENLSLIGIQGFVLGDEWPRGLNDEEITIQGLSRHNQTYHDETGRWMRLTPSVEEKVALADWFYDHSLEAWNSIARRIRHRFPDINLGTNIDLVWGPDFTRSDVAHWKATDWWGDVDLAPYDFVVAHYFTGMLRKGQEDPVEVDYSSMARLRESLESLLDPSSDLTLGRDVFLMLGAHCSYPYVITPMQMIQEWNMVLEFRDRLAGVGWFTFDLWIYGDSIVCRSITGQSPAPMKEDRLIIAKWLGRLSECGECGEWNIGPQVILQELSNTTLVEGDEVELDLTIRSLGWEGDLSLKGIRWSPDPDVILDYHIVDSPPSSVHGHLGFLPSDGTINTRILVRAHRQRYSQDPISGSLLFLLGPTTCDEGVGSLKLLTNKVWLTAINALWESGPARGVNGIYIDSIMPRGNGGYLVEGQAQGVTGKRLAYLVMIDDESGSLWESIYGREGDNLVCIAALDDAGVIMVTYAGGNRQLLRVDGRGRKLWEKPIGEYLPSAIMPTGDGGFILAGSDITWEDGWDAFLLRLDSEGSKVWKRTYGGKGRDIIGRLVESSDKGFIMAGAEIVHGAGYDHRDIWLLRTDQDGNMLWNRTFGGCHDEGVNDILVMDDGGFLVAGYTSSTGNDEWDVYLLRINAEGNLVWERTYGAEGYDDAYSLAGNSDGTYLLARLGGTRLLKIDGEGRVVWEKRIEATDIVGDVDGCLALTPDGRISKISGNGTRVWEMNIVSPGSILSTATIEDGGIIGAGWIQSEEGGTDILLTRIDGENRIVWRKTFEGKPDSAESAAKCITTTDDSGYLVAGGTTSIYGDDDVYLMKVSSNGSKVWEKTLHAPGQNCAEAITKTHDGSHILVFNTVAADSEEGDICLLGISGNGTILWEKSHGQPGWEHASDIAGSNDTEYLVVGETLIENDTMHAYLLMIDNKGDKKWARTYGISGQASAQCAIEICGGFLIGGYTSASEGVLRPLRNSCSYILRIDKKGNKVWEKTYPWIGPLAFGEPVGIKGIAPSGKGGFLAISGHDFLMKIDDEGNSIFEHYLGECPESIIALPDGTHMIAGSRDIQWGHGWDSWEDRDPYFLRFQEASETIPVFIITLALLALLLSRTK